MGMARTDEMMPVRRVSKESLLYLPGKLAFASMAVIATPIYTRYFTPEELGRFDLALKFALFVWTLCILWLGNVILRFYPAYAHRGEERAFFTVIALLRWCGYLLGLGICGLVWLAGPESLVGSYRNLLGLAALAFVGRSSFELGLVLINVQRRPIAHSVASTINAIAKLTVGMLIAIPLRAGVAGLLWAAALVPMVVYLVSMRRGFGGIRFRLGHTERAFLSEAWRYGLPIIFTLVLAFFLANSDRYLLKFFRDDAEVGVFSIGYFLADQPVQFIYSTLMIAAFPAITHMYERLGREATAKLVSSLARLYLLVAVPAVVLLGVLAKPVLFSLAHGAPRESYIVVPWIAAAAGILGLTQYYTAGLYLAKRTSLTFASSAVATAINALANCVLIPQYGYYGCGVVRLISNAVLLALLIVVSRRCLPWRFPWLSASRIVTAAAVAGGAAYLLGKDMSPGWSSLIGLSILGALLYAGSILALREVTRDEIQRFLVYLLKR